MAVVLWRCNTAAPTSGTTGIDNRLLHIVRLVSAAVGGAEARVVAAHARTNLELSHKELCRLRPGEWLGDEVMNMYAALLQVGGSELGHAGGFCAVPRTLSVLKACWFMNSASEGQVAARHHFWELP